MSDVRGLLSEWIPESALRFFPLENELFSGGLGLAAMGVGLQFLRRSSTTLSMLARRHFMMTLEVTSKDVTYPWVLQWLNAHGRPTQHLSVTTAVERAIDGSSHLTFDLVPGPGKHLVTYGGRLFLVERQREHQSFAMNTGEPWEKVLLTSFGRDVSVFDNLLEEARSMNNKQEEGATVIYTCWGTEWRPFGHPRRKRPLDSVVLDDGVKESIVADLEEWRSSAGWYHDRGIPYRRGYLLHGPPGSGKSSFIVSLAGEMDYNICIMALSDEGLTDDRLAQALSVVPQRSIVLLEDIDAAFGTRVKGEVGSSGANVGRSNLTFSGLLNTLDGVASSEERIIFMTTNYLERLDPALMRPGRVDSVHLLGNATESQARRLFLRFYENCDPVLADAFAMAVDALPHQCSMAELQGHLMDHKDAPEGAVRSIPGLQIAIEERAHRVALQEEEARRMAAMAGYEDTNSGMYVNRRRGGRRLTADEVDKMAFNPQPGWEEAVGLK